MAAVIRMAMVTAMAATAAAIRPTPTTAPRTGAAPIRATRSAGPIGAAIPVIGERAAPIGAAITATERIGGGHRQRRWPAAVPWLRWEAPTLSRGDRRVPHGGTSRAERKVPQQEDGEQVASVWSRGSPLNEIGNRLVSDGTIEHGGCRG